MQNLSLAVCNFVDSCRRTRRRAILFVVAILVCVLLTFLFVFLRFGRSKGQVLDLLSDAIILAHESHRNPSALRPTEPRTDLLFEIAKVLSSSFPPLDTVPPRSTCSCPPPPTLAKDGKPPTARCTAESELLASNERLPGEDFSPSKSRILTTDESKGFIPTTEWIEDLSFSAQHALEIVRDYSISEQKKDPSRIKVTNDALWEITSGLTRATDLMDRAACKAGSVSYTPSGGYCAVLPEVVVGEHAFDTNLADALVKLVWDPHRAKSSKISIADLGAGPGWYGDYWKTNSYQSSDSFTYQAYDGAAGTEEVFDNVRLLNLAFRNPISLFFPSFDWIMSLEVGEHLIPDSKAEFLFLDNIALHADVGVVLSWGVLHQGGPGHQNCHSNQWVVERMKERGFEVDREVTRQVREAAEFLWFKNSLMVFRRI